MRRQYAHLHLHGTDVEALAYRVINTWQRKHTTLNPTDTEDLLAYLVATTWELAQKHDPRRSTRFDPYSLLLLRCNDWLREREGRTRWEFGDHVYERTRPDVLSLDGPGTRTGTDRAPERLGDRIPDVEPGSESDVRADRSAALVRLIAFGHRETTRLDNIARPWIRQQMAERTQPVKEAA